MGPVNPRMTLLEVMSQWRSSEKILQAYENRLGNCLRCHALFDTLEEAAQKYNLDLEQLLADLIPRPAKSTQERFPLLNLNRLFPSQFFLLH